MCSFPCSKLRLWNHQYGNITSRNGRTGVCEKTLIRRRILVGKRLSERQIRGWRAVSAAALQGQGLRISTHVCSDTGRYPCLSKRCWIAGQGLSSKDLLVVVVVVIIGIVIFHGIHTNNSSCNNNNNNDNNNNSCCKNSSLSPVRRRQRHTAWLSASLRGGGYYYQLVLSLAVV